MIFEILTNILIDYSFDFFFDITITKLSLRLSLELWFGDLDGDDSIESIRHILESKFPYFLIKFLCLFRHLIDTSEEGIFETDYMRTTIFRRDIIHERDKIIIGVIYKLENDFCLTIFPFLIDTMQ